MKFKSEPIDGEAIASENTFLVTDVIVYVESVYKEREYNYYLQVFIEEWTYKVLKEGKEKKISKKYIDNEKCYESKININNILLYEILLHKIDH